MPRPARTAPPKRDAILDGAWGVFLKHGYALATMDEIAAAAGVSKRTVYDHFPSKEQLFGAIVERRRDEMLQGLAAGYPTTRKLMGVAGGASARDLSAQVRLAVRICLNGCGARPRRRARRG